MTDSISDLLQNRNIGEPPEIRIIKDFVLAEVNIEPNVKVTQNSFIVSLPTAAAAGTLRFRLFQLQRQLGDKRKIIIRIS